MDYPKRAVASGFPRETRLVAPLLRLVTLAPWAPAGQRPELIDPPAPTLIFVGRHNDAVPLSSSRALREHPSRIPRARSCSSPATSSPTCSSRCGSGRGGSCSGLASF